MSLTTPSERLQAKLGLAYPAMRASAERIWCSPAVRELYPVYLSAMHGIGRSAVPLLEAALERARALAAEDEMAASLVPYFAQHVKEEAGHDRWLLEDLAALGRDPVETLRRIPSARIATLVGAQYYWLRHYHPLSLLGHLAVVEGYGPQIGFAERLRELTDYPADAFCAIRRHEQLDIGHRRDLYALIDSLPLQVEHETLLGVSALHTILAAIEVFEEIYAAVSAAARVEVAG